MDEDFRRSLKQLEPRQRIAALRKHIGMSQQQLASRLDVHWITISRLERGIIRINRDWIERIAIALTMNTDDISDEHIAKPTIQVHGDIVKGGLLLKGGMAKHITNHENLSGDVTYYSVECRDFEPLACRGSIVRMVQVRKHQIGLIVGHLCLASPKDKKEKVFGFFEFASNEEDGNFDKWDKKVIRNMKGDVILDDDFDIESVATDITFVFPDESTGILERQFLKG